MDPPALLSERAFTEQIKKEALHPDGLTIVIVPTNLISIPLLHSRVVKGLLMGQWLLSGRRREYDLAYGPDEGDPWHGQTGPYEAFLVALSERGAEVNGKKESRVVVLGGDIHFSYASRLGYWAKHPYQATSDSPRRLVVAHLTSSSLKHQVSLTEFLHKHGYGWPPRQFQWIGWNRPPGKTGVVIGTEWERNRGAEYFKLQKPYFLSRSPAMLLLTDISPDSSVTVEPDWRYRIDFLNAILGPANDGIETIDLPSAAKPNQWWLSESKKAAEAHRKYITDKSGSEIIGVTNLALLQFKWNSDDDKSVTQSNWWRLTDQTHIAELNRYEVSLALDDANFAMPKYPDES